MSLGELDAIGRALGSWVLAASLWTGLVLAATLVADRLLRRVVSPGGRMLLFAVVLARLALPIDFSSPLGLAPPVAVEHASVVLPDATPTHATAMSTVAPASEPGPSEALPWGLAILGVYAIGVVALGSAFAASHRRLHRRLRAGARERDVDGGAPVLEHRTVGPLAHGGRVVIPRRLFEELDDQALRAVVQHERAHLRYRDPLLAAALAVLCVAAWPVIPVWIAAQRIRFLMELRADATAVAGLDDAGRDAYRRVMLRVAAIGWRTPALAPGFGPVAALEARLAALGGPSLGPLWLQLVASASIAGAFLCCAARGESDEAVDAAAVAVVDAADERAPCSIPVRGAEHEPSDAERIEASARLRAELGAATPETAEAVAQRIVDEATRRQLPRVRAEARLVHAQQLAARGAYEAASTELEEAAWDAASSGHDGVAAVATGELVTLLLTTGDADALAWLRHHDAALRSAASDTPLPHEERMLVALVAHYRAAGDPQASAARQDRLDLVRDACR